MAPLLFTPVSLRSLELVDRAVVSPMCQYQALMGAANDWHLVHLGGLAMGAGSLLIVEATHVSAEARITPGCLGLWNEEQERALAPVVAFCRRYGTAKLGIQLAHAGRKASCNPPLRGSAPLTADEGAWQTVSASALPYADGWHTPRAASLAGIARIRADFVASTQRAARLGFDLVELHMAHGYLLHQFLSPLANRREDDYGGSFENRIRLPLEVFTEVRAAWPAERPLGVRVSATDWVEGGWSPDETVELARRLKALGCDYVDVSSGGLHPAQQLKLGPGYQVPFAERVRREAGITTMSVGLLVTAKQAEAILQEGRADLIGMARTVMDDPRWAWHAAQELGAEVRYPDQYIRCQPKSWPGAALKRAG